MLNYHHRPNKGRVASAVDLATESTEISSFFSMNSVNSVISVATKPLARLVRHSKQRMILTHLQ